MSLCWITIAAHPCMTNPCLHAPGLKPSFPEGNCHRLQAAPPELARPSQQSLMASSGTAARSSGTSLSLPSSPSSCSADTILGKEHRKCVITPRPLDTHPAQNACHKIPNLQRAHRLQADMSVCCQVYIITGLGQGRCSRRARTCFPGESLRREPQHEYS